jgi:diadenosine tetraphosphate (Ap4A) HIT family hydrolase
LSLPISERIVVTPGWRVVHSFDTSLPGWLVVVPRRHVEAMAELTEEEAAALGPLLRGASIALRRVTGCVKTYVMLYAEREGFEHLHVHVVPRMPDMPADRQGPGVFEYLRETPLPESDRDAVAARLQSAWP